MKTIIATIALALAASAQAAPLTLTGNGITIKTCDHDAGAICSVTWNGKEFIDDYDHGRQLQSAVAFGPTKEDVNGNSEAYNPTEAGASVATNGINPSPSSSVQLEGSVSNGVLYTKTQMAYFIPVNGVALSNNYVQKWVSIGLPGMPNVIKYTTTFTRAWGETHGYGQYESLTGYMPAAFSSFYTLDVVGGAWTPQPLSDGPGEQTKPVIMCTPDSQYCMGIYSRNVPQPTYPDAGYGRWRFTYQNVVKWNVVTRLNNPPYLLTLTQYVLVGTLDQVTTQMRQLHASSY
jgi:hypothetical protein